MEEADIYADDIKEDDGVTTFTIHHAEQSLLAVLPTVGIHNVKNALAAYLVGNLAGMTAQEIICGLAKYQPAGNRQNIKQKDGITVIADCYNASPDSQAAALAVLGGMSAKRKIAVIGDMLAKGTATVKVLKTTDKWFGVTYAADKEYVKESIRALISRGDYAEDLWSALK